MLYRKYRNKSCVTQNVFYKKNNCNYLKHLRSGVYTQFHKTLSFFLCAAYFGVLLEQTKIEFQVLKCSLFLYAQHQ